MKFDEACGENDIDLNKIPDLTESELSASDKWIRSKYNNTIQVLNKLLDEFKVTEYSKSLYDFIWSDFCAWYVEIVKVQFAQNESAAYRLSLMKFAIDLYEGILLLLHPVMPFITEEIWHILCVKGDNESISLEKSPIANHAFIDQAILTNFELLQLIVEEVRRLRASMNIQPSKKLPVTIATQDESIIAFLREQENSLAYFMKSDNIEISATATKPEGAMASVVREIQVFLDAGSAIDIPAERARMEKEIARLEGNIIGCERKLSNEKFVQNASAEIVQNEREKLESMRNSLAQVKENLANLK